MRTRTENIAGWITLVAGVVVALLYLNGVAASLWAAGGPPTTVREAWMQRAFAHFCYSGAAVLFGCGLFRGLRVLPRVDRIAVVLLVLAAGAVAAPSAREFSRADECLDAGGRWNRAAFRCER